MQENSDATGMLTSFPYHSLLSLFTNASWSEQSQCCGMGFVLINANKMVILVGTSFGIVEFSIQAKAKFMEVAIRCYTNRDLTPYK